MRTIVESLQEFDFQDISNVYYEGEDVDEGLKDIWVSFRDKLKYFFKKVKNRVISFFSDGTPMPVTTPATTGLAVQSGEGGRSTFYCPVKDDIRYGVSKVSIDDIIKDFKNSKKSFFESSIGRKANVLEGSEYAALSLSGNGLYGPDVDTAKLEFFLKATIKAGERGVPILVWGAPGIGKTAIVSSVLKQFSDKKRIIVKNLGQCNPDDFTLPAFDTNEFGQKVAIELPKTWLPCYRVTGDPAVDAVLDNIANGGDKEGKIGEGGVIFFDEIARCKPSVQGVALSLIQDRQIVDYRLGSKWSIIAASNREGDDPSTDITLSKALGNRFRQVNFIPAFDSWEAWAKKHKYMNEEVLNFLKFNQKYWYYMHGEDEDEKVYATPRSWANCCLALCQMSMGSEEDGYSLDEIPDDIIQLTLESFVQPEVAAEFMTYYALTKAIDIDALYKVWDDPKKAPSLLKDKKGKTVRTDLKYYMVSKVLSKLDPNVYPEVQQLDNLAIWLGESKDESVAIAALNILYDMYPMLFMMIGNPRFEGAKDWDKYVSMVNILIEKIPGVDKDFDFEIN